MSTPYVAEIRIMSFNFPPKGWALCDGQLLPINQNQALFSLLGTAYGGDGRVTFGLPDLRGRAPIHMGGGFTLGQGGGEETHTLTVGETPTHSHPVAANAAAADQVSPVGNYWGNGGEPAYATSSDGTIAWPQAVSTVGGSQPHDNLSPLLVLSFCIALQGIFPSQN